MAYPIQYQQNPLLATPNPDFAELSKDRTEIYLQLPSKDWKAIAQATEIAASAVVAIFTATAITYVLRGGK